MLEDSSDVLLFADDVQEYEPEIKGSYKVLIADDEEEVHRITKLVFNHFNFHGNSLEFIDTYSGEETKKVLRENSDIAILFLDVVMENTHAGLSVVKYLRTDLNNKLTRIILRTGEPGEAPEEDIIRDYDINDYRLKTELTNRRLKTTMYSALRNYRDLLMLQNHKKGLEKIISSSANLFNKHTLTEFLQSILQELSSFQLENQNMVYMKQDKLEKSGLISQKDGKKNKIIAATGKYSSFNGDYLNDVNELKELNNYLDSNEDTETVKKLDNGLLVANRKHNVSDYFIYIEGNPKEFDFDLINLFLTNFSITLENFILSNMIQSTQEEIVFALAKTVECNFEETGNHIKRISTMMYNFAILLHFSTPEAEMMKLASTMHDVGKIAVSDLILKKPGKLTDIEFESMKKHVELGYNILKGSELPVLKQAADIAYYHHEKYDGSGYPQGKRGSDIPISGRMIALIDVFDALTHKRCYKEAMTNDEAVEILLKGRGSHFDPKLLDIFLDNLDSILKDVGE